MKHRLFTVLLTLSLATVFLACTKDSADEEAPTVTATITIASPAEGAIFRNGDSIIVQGTAVGTDVLHGYEVYIRKAGDPATTYFFQHIHDHNDTLLFRQGWKNNLTAPASLDVLVTVYVDDAGHTNTRKVGIRVE